MQTEKKINEKIKALHPGRYIAEIISNLGMSQEEFATRIGTSGKTLSKLVNGQSNLSNDMARKISVMFGSKVEVWLNLQKRYDEKILQTEQARAFVEQIEVMRQIDYLYFVKLDLLPETKSIARRIANLCKYLMVADLRVFLQPDFMADLTAAEEDTGKEVIVNTQIWLQTALNQAREQKGLQPYSGAKLKESLPQMRELSTQKPDSFLPELTRILADCGVSLVLLPALRHAGIMSAVKWISPSQAMLAIRAGTYATADFWFLFFTMLRHVLQQKVKKVFISSHVPGLVVPDPELAADAAQFAAKLLVPENEYAIFEAKELVSDADITEFAEKIKTHTSIVAARLNQDGHIAKQRFADLNPRYRLSV